VRAHGHAPEQHGPGPARHAQHVGGVVGDPQAATGAHGRAAAVPPQVIGDQPPTGCDKRSTKGTDDEARTRAGAVRHDRGGNGSLVQRGADNSHGQRDIVIAAGQVHPSILTSVPISGQTG